MVEEEKMLDQLAVFLAAELVQEDIENLQEQHLVVIQLVH